MRIAGAARRWPEKLLSPLSTEVWRWAERFRYRHGYDSLNGMTDSLDGPEKASDRPSESTHEPLNLITDHINAILAVFGMAWTVGLYIAFPFPTTIPLFVGAAVCLSGWTLCAWLKIAFSILRSKQFSTTFAHWSVRHRIGLVGCTCLVSFWLSLGFVPPAEQVPPLQPTVSGVPDKFFIAASLYNSEAIFGDWSRELLKLTAHREFPRSTPKNQVCSNSTVGEENTFISIYESNSNDTTKSLLEKFRTTLDTNGIGHRIVMEDQSYRWWPYGTAPERIQLIADARNMALEPLQSANATVRLEDHDAYAKVIFLNDIFFSYESIVRLIATRLDGDTSLPPNYDLACAMDYGASGKSNMPAPRIRSV